MGIFLYVPIAGVIVSLLEIEEIVGEIMTETALDHFWQLVFGDRPKAEAFECKLSPREQGSIVLY